MIGARSITPDLAHTALALICPDLRHKTGCLFSLNNCHNGSSQAETVAHRLPANRLRTGIG